MKTNVNHPLFSRVRRWLVLNWFISKCGSLVFILLKIYFRSKPVTHYAAFVELLNETARTAFEREIPNIGSNVWVGHPYFLANPQCISIGSNFYSQAGLRIEAVCEWKGRRYTPQIRIGDNVAVHQNVHIGAVDRIEIGNNTAIGSHVLITDHAHGSFAEDDLDVPPMERSLYSKGPVIIEDNVWIGEGACILPNVRIGRGAVIGANAVVTSDVQCNCIVGGVPARLIRG